VVGVQDAGLIAEIQRQCPLLLVIEPSRRRLERLRSAWGQHPAGLQFWQDPVGAAEEKVRWYSYNDSRLDGRRSPAELSNTLKNVSLLDEECRQAHALGQVVNEWLGTPDSLPEGGVLFLQNSDPEPLIIGASSLLPSLAHLVLWTESTAEWQPASINESLEICLEEACFCRSSDEAFHWEKDDRLLLLRQLESLEALVARLRVEHSEQAHLMKEQQREAMELAESRIALLAQLEQRASQGESLRMALDLAQKQAQDLGQHCSALEAEQAEFRARVAVLERQVCDSENQRAEVLSKCEQLEQQSAHWAERVEVLTREKQDLQAQAEAGNREREAILAEKSSLAAENDHLHLENQDMRRRLDELSRLTTNSEQEMAFIRELVIQAGIKREMESS
jgi:regulator of replication initiation timing